MKHNSFPFKWRHYEALIILLCVRWYLRYQLSYRDLEEIMHERGLAVDHYDPERTTLRLSRLSLLRLSEPDKRRSRLGV